MKLIKTKCVIGGHHLSELPIENNEKHPIALEIKSKLRQNIIELIDDGVKIFMCGMDLGVEMWAGEILLDLKKDYSDIKIHSVIASENRADHWSEEDRERYFDKILPFCDEETYTSIHNDDEAKGYHNNFLSRRADVYLVVWNGGEICDTADLVRKAKKMKKEVIVLDV